VILRCSHRNGPTCSTDYKVIYINKYKDLILLSLSRKDELYTYTHQSSSLNMRVRQLFFSCPYFFFHLKNIYKIQSEHNTDISDYIIL